MYNTESINVLIDRVGWANVIEPSDIVVSEENLTSTSGRLFNSFHQLVTVENVFSAIPNKNANVQELNGKLYELKRQSVLDVLHKVYDMNLLATSATHNGFTSLNYLVGQDYSNIIIERSPVFDEAIGIRIAIKALELMLTTSRSNINTSNAKYSYNAIREALDGSFTAEGKLLSYGLYAKYNKVINDTINVLFLVKAGPEIYGDALW